MMWKNCYISCVTSSYLIFFSLINPICIRGQDVGSFDDNVHFKINWPGQSVEELLPNAELYPITTADNERYVCSIPYTTNQEQDETEPYTEHNPIDILSLLFIGNQCSHKLDSYWTYEVCHGRSVRQYHEDREGKEIIRQEYILGMLNETQKMKLTEIYAEREKLSNRKALIPMKKVDNINMPYVEVEMNEGTLCDLNSKPRKTKVLYVCSPDVQHEIYSLKETLSCEYEAVVKTSFLCRHPDYKPKTVRENDINCRPVDKTLKKPKSLMAMDIESMRLRHHKVTDNRLPVVAIFHVDKEGQDGETHVRVEIHPLDFADKHSAEEDSLNSLTNHLSSAEANPVQNFLSGKTCLQGGNGWWKYEFCHGRHVSQYHIEKDGKKTIVNLGKFDRAKHSQWLKKHPNKRPESINLRKSLSHFYSDGHVCDKTGKPRQTEVVLKCLESNLSSPSSVSLSLLEHNTCEYSLKVESSLICDILEHADEEGLLDDKIKVNSDKLKTTFYQVDQDDLNERIANDDD